MQTKKIWGTLDPFVESGGILGRGVANQGFLDALLRLDPFDGYDFFLGHSNQAEQLRRFAGQRHPMLFKSGRLRISGRADLLQALRQEPYHCFHLSDCINHPAHLARLRNAVAPRIFPVTSLTHSLSYPRYGKEFLAHVWPGCTPRDAVVATSETACQAVRAYHDHALRAYGLDPLLWKAPRVALLPLGIELADFTPPDVETRQRLRQERGIAPRRIVLLAFARLTHTGKLDALCLLRALRRAMTPPLSADSFTLVLAGGFDQREGGDYLEQLLRLGNNLDLRIMVVRDPDDAERHALFSVADIFVSPVDNYQETFGLSLLEAGAMELPVVASDFDGYRSLVQHERTGFLVPTLGSAESALLDSLGHVLLDNQHHLLAAQGLAVDVPALAQAIRTLAMSSRLRAAMGRAGRDRVIREFTWDAIVRRYVGLWEELWEESIPEQEMERLRTVAHPMHAPLAEIFSAYPTTVLEPGLRLRWSAAGEACYRGREGLVIYGGLQGFLEPDRVRRLVFAARAPSSVGELTQRLMDAEGITAELAEWLLLWALKHDLLEREPD